MFDQTDELLHLIQSIRFWVTARVQETDLYPNSNAFPDHPNAAPLQKIPCNDSGDLNFGVSSHTHNLSEGTEEPLHTPVTTASQLTSSLVSSIHTQPSTPSTSENPSSDSALYDEKKSPTHASITKSQEHIMQGDPVHKSFEKSRSFSSSPSLDKWSLSPMPSLTAPPLMPEQFVGSFKIRALYLPVRIYTENAQGSLFLESVSRAITRQFVPAICTHALSLSMDHILAHPSIHLVIAQTTLLNTHFPNLQPHQIVTCKHVFFLSLFEETLYPQNPLYKRSLWNLLKTFSFKNMPLSS